MLSADDRLNLLDLYSRINFAYDAGDGEAFADCFTDDARYERPLVAGGLCTSGRAEMVELIRSKVAKSTEPKYHLSLNISLQPGEDADSARGHCYHVVITQGEPGAPPRFHATGTCEDTFVRSPQGWRVERRLKKHAFTE